MGSFSKVVLMLMLMLVVVVAFVSAYDVEEERGEEGEGEGEGWFLLHDSKEVVRTDAGVMRVVRRGGFGGRGGVSLFQSPMHIGFITMEPNTLFIPHYLDSHLTLFVRRGETRIGHIYKDDFTERRLKEGDVYSIRAGSAFYLVNPAEGQRLHIICSISTSSSLGLYGFQSFFIGGGIYPTSILGGFDKLTLSTAFNVSSEEVGEILTRQLSGAIVPLNTTHSPTPSIWANFLNLEQHQRHDHLKRIVRFEEEASLEEEEDEEREQQPPWSLRKFLNSLFGDEGNKRDKKRGDEGSRGRGKGPDSYNLFDRKPDYKNDYGWSLALDKSEYPPLKHTDVGVYLVNLSAGAMMTPHINPTATEYGVVLRGSGSIQIVYPNGTLAMNAIVNEGDVFWVPRYFPFCQIASRTGPLEFFGFTTTAKKNRPQFLVGRDSILQSMRGPEFAAAFGVSEERLRKILDAQREAVILPSASVAPSEPMDPGEEEQEGERGEKGKEKEEQEGERGEKGKEKEEEKSVMKIPKVIKSLGNDMIMGFA
ncbi:putative something about silencing protein 10-like [Capsicum annuum]|uniref:vicilin-like seed storage protein At2g28490 n=1 Tax=Capsicum annuum TaxID=4072 RepID=UPI0007BEE28B|nr:vicilin-like seed storage protein At2g28490 [Capsicum annuum]KAF3648638.1 putative something about silencing protein 10-like [Capsicum annuum]